jgi:enoyl-CoA hydratase/carnithine racemase
VAVRNDFHIWSVAAGRSKSFSARTISMATPRNDTDTSTGHFQTAELDGFVDALARRIASFDRRAIAAAKNLINQVSLPSADQLLDAITSFETALTWPEAQQRIQNVLQRGLQRDSDFETHWPEVLGTLLET